MRAHDRKKNTSMRHSFPEASLGRPLEPHVGPLESPRKPLDVRESPWEGSCAARLLCRACGMRLPCVCHEFALRVPCHRHAFPMRLPCVCAAFAMPLPCVWHALAMRLPCACHALLCVRHALGVLLPCACHVFVKRVAPRTAQKFKKSYTCIKTHAFDYPGSHQHA